MSVIEAPETRSNRIAAIGAKLGAKTHTLTQAEMPSHTHVQNSHNHVQNAHDHGTLVQGSQLTPAQAVAVSVTDGGSTRYALRSNTGTVLGTGSTTATNQASTATNQNTGGGGAHNNVQPSFVCRYVIRAA